MPYLELIHTETLAHLKCSGKVILYIISFAYIYNILSNNQDNNQ